MECLRGPLGGATVIVGLSLWLGDASLSLWLADVSLSLWLGHVEAFESLEPCRREVTPWMSSSFGKH